MKSDIHPDYRPVVFMDASADFSILTKSTIQTSDTVEWGDGNTYPLAKVEISSASHPFYTGTMKIIDSAGRVEKFEQRYGRRRKKAGTDEAEPKADEATSAVQKPVKGQPVVEEDAPSSDSEESAS